MKKSRCSVLFVVGLLAVVGLFGCNRGDADREDESCGCIRQCGDAGSGPGCGGCYKDSAG